MRSNIRKALQIASGSQREFDDAMNSGQFSAQQVREARLLRAEIATRANGMAKKQTLGERLLDSGHHVAISKQEQEEDMRPIDWTAHGLAVGEALRADTEALCKRGVPREQASAAAAFSPEVAEAHYLEKKAKGLLTNEDLCLEEMRKSGSVTDPSPMGPRMQSSPTVVGGVQRPVAALGHFNDFPAVRAQTHFNSPGDSNEVVDAADLLQQRARALKDKNPGLSMSAAMDQALKEPRVRKAYADERSARLLSASRLYS